MNQPLVLPRGVHLPRTPVHFRENTHHAHWSDLEAVLYEALWARTPAALRAIWLVDTTSLYFESTRTDEDYAATWAAHEAAAKGKGKAPLAPVPQVVNDPPVRLRGYNKDGHPQDPQVVLASVVTPGGQIVRHRVYPGNTNDATICRDLVAAWKPPVGTQALWIADAGLVGTDQLAALDDAGWHRLTAESARRNKTAETYLLPLTGKYRPHTTEPKWSFREIVLSPAQSPSGRAEKWFLVRNQLERERALAKLQPQRARVQEGLAKQKGAKPHGKNVCQIASHPTLKKFVRPSDARPGQYVFAEEVFRREEQLAGTRLYRSTLTDWSAEDLHTAYMLLQEVEANHRELKTPLRLRPCYHRLTERIEAHVMLNVLAINCMRRLEARTGCHAHDLRTWAGAVKAVEMAQGDRAWWQLTDLDPAFLRLLRRLETKRPPQTWTIWNEKSPAAQAPKRSSTLPSRR